MLNTAECDGEKRNVRANAISVSFAMSRAIVERKFVFGWWEFWMKWNKNKNVLIGKENKEKRVRFRFFSGVLRWVYWWDMKIECLVSVFFGSEGVYVGVTEKREGWTSDEKTRGRMYTWHKMKWGVVLLFLQLVDPPRVKNVRCSVNDTYSLNVQYTPKFCFWEKECH